MPSPRAADDARRPARPLRRRGLARVAVGGAVVLAALLTACTGEPAAEPTPRRSASTTPTVEPTPTATTTPAPERPAAMDDPGVDGAVAAATYFVDLYGYVGGGDLTAWNSLSHPECTFCTGVSAEVEQMSALGHRQEGPQITVNSTEPTEVTPGEFYSVELLVTQGPWREIDANGAVVEERTETVDATLLIVVIREAGQWLVRAGQSDVTG